VYHLIQSSMVEPQVRQHICNRCWRRPRHSESLPPSVPRSCEAACPIFDLLPSLVQRAHLMDPMITSREHALRTIIDQHCHDSPNDIGTLALYGSCLAHLVGEAVDKSG
jgi:hypothetical protein